MKGLWIFLLHFNHLSIFFFHLKAYLSISVKKSTIWTTIKFNSNVLTLINVLMHNYSDLISEQNFLKRVFWQMVV